MELSKIFFTVISGPHLLHVSWLLGCEDPKQMTWVLYDINSSCWTTTSFFSRRKGRTSATLGMGRKGWSTSYIADISPFPSSLDVQQGYSHLWDSHICGTSKHTTGAGCVASAHNANKYINIAGEKIPATEESWDLWKCWDRCHWRSDILCHLFK